MKIPLPRLTCLRCGWPWTPRKEDVNSCPSCRSVFWDVPPLLEDSNFLIEGESGVVWLCVVEDDVLDSLEGVE